MIDGAGAGRYRGVREPPPSAFRGRGWSHFLSGVFLKRLISMMDLLHCHKRCLENRSDVLCYHQPTCGNSRNLRVCLFVYGRGGRGPTAGRKLEILNYIWCPNITRCHGSVAAAGVGSVECVCNDSIKTNICSEN